MITQVADALPPEQRRVPILASPRLAVERARDVLADLPAHR